MNPLLLALVRFSTLRCGSWIDAFVPAGGAIDAGDVSVPFDAGRGLMPGQFTILATDTNRFQYPSMRVVD